MTSVPIRVEENPPQNVATMGSALNLAVLLEVHREDLYRRASRELQASKSLLFHGTVALAARRARDRSRLGVDTIPWQMVRQLLLPVDSLTVEFTVREKTREQGRVVANRLLQAMQAEHHSMHRRQPNSPDGWTVSRVALKADPRLVTLHCLLSPQRLLDAEFRHTAGTNDGLLAKNYAKLSIPHALLPDVLPTGTPTSPVTLATPELHLLFFGFVHDIAYSRGRQTAREVAFFSLYLLSAHLLILQHHNPATFEPLHLKLRSLYVTLPPDGAGENDSGMSQALFKAVLGSARGLPHIVGDFYENQRNWHLNLKAQKGTGGVRDPQKLLQQYEQFFTGALRWLQLAVEGPAKHPNDFPSTAHSLSRSAPYHPLARRAFA